MRRLDINPRRRIQPPNCSRCPRPKRARPICIGRNTDAIYRTVQLATGDATNASWRPNDRAANGHMCTDDVVRPHWLIRSHSAQPGGRLSELLRDSACPSKLSFVATVSQAADSLSPGEQLGSVSGAQQNDQSGQRIVQHRLPRSSRSPTKREKGRFEHILSWSTSCRNSRISSSRDLSWDAFLWRLLCGCATSCSQSSMSSRLPASPSSIVLPHPTVRDFVRRWCELIQRDTSPRVTSPNEHTNSRRLVQLPDQPSRSGRRFE